MKKEIIGKLLYIGFCGILAYSGYILISYLRIYPNIFQLDMGGQIASAEFFSRYGIHSYNPHRFGGFINNLFYPPLQDIIVTTIKNIWGGTTQYSFQIYLTILIIAYLSGFVAISTRFKTRQAKSFFIVIILGYLHLDKQFLTHFQGLGYIDIAFTGLISEVLGGVFLNFLIYELLGTTKRYNIILLYSCLSFLSHLVVGPFAFLLMGLGWIIQKDRRLFWNCILGMGLTAFFRIPFMKHGDFMTSDSIVLGFPYLITIGLIFGIRYLAQVKNKSWIIFAIAGLGILLPSEIFFLFDFNIASFHHVFPKFHYSRLVIISIFMLILTASQYIDENIHKSQSEGDNEGKKEYKQHIFIIIMFLIIFTKTFNFIYLPDVFKNMVGFTDRAGFNLDVIKKINDEKRILVIDSKRAVDFNIDSYFHYQGYTGLNFVKGLFRESNRANNVLTSYLATTLKNSDLVVGYNYFYNLSCEQYQGFMDHFVTDYGVGWMISADLFANVQYLEEMKKRCYDAMFRAGTYNYSYEFVGDFGINNVKYHIFKITKKENLSNEVIHIIPQNKEVVILDNKSSDFYYDKVTLSKRDEIDFQLRNSGSIAGVPHKIFIVKQDYEKNNQNPKDLEETYSSSGTIENTTLSGNILQFESNSSGKTLIQIRTTFYPGLQAFANDKPISLYPLYHGFAIESEGKQLIRIEYNRTSIFFISYRISIVSSLLYSILIIKSIIKRTRNHIL